MARHLRIAGQVQGVGYRASFHEQACALGLAGWVRNRSDGSVEAVVSGAPEAIESITGWARQGPRTARVSDVAVSEIEDASVRQNDFVVLPTL